jgi:hypothetical protein
VEASTPAGAFARVLLATALAMGASSLPAQRSHSSQDGGTLSDSIRAALVLLAKPVGCVASLPRASMHRVRVFLSATVPESSERDFRLQTDLMAQDVAAELRKLLGATGDSVPTADSVFVWYSVPTALRVVAHSNGEMSARPIGAGGDSAATRLLLRAYDIARAQSEAFIAWPDGQDTDSLVVYLFLRPEYVDEEPTVLSPHGVFRRFAAFFLTEPERVSASPLPDQRSPRYPSRQESHRVEGEVLLQFVIDSTGRVEPETISDPWPADTPQPSGYSAADYDDFARSAKSWIKDYRFSPARIGPCLVRQAAQIPLKFVAPR